MFGIIIAVLFLAFVVTVQIPVEIYLNNADEFILPLRTLAYLLSAAFGIACLVLLLPLVVTITAFRERYFSFLAMLALLIWVNAHFMFGQYGAFDGHGLSIDKFSLRAVIEAVVWVVALAGALIFSKKLQAILFQVVSALLTITVTLTAYQIIHYTLYENKHFTPEQNQDQFMTEEFLTFSTRGNIIHIVLDEQQSTIVDLLMAANPRFKQHLKGFTYFPNTTSNFRSTLMAIPAILTGQLYKNEDNKNRFLQQALSHNTFTAALEKANYKTHIYTKGFYCNVAKIKNCIPQPELSLEMNAVLLLDYSLFKAVPDIMKPVIYHQDRWFIKRYFTNVDYTTSHPGLSHLAFNYFNAHLTVKDIEPTYKFYHTMISHSPAVLKEDCGLRVMKTNHNHVSVREEQSACAFQHVFTFLNKLQEAGIYDNTFIIISSDHGASILTHAQKENLRGQNTVHEDHYPRALATLLIKPFNTKAPLQVSYAPAALNDIPNTILASLDLPLLPYGENVLALTDTTKRTREFVYHEIVDWWSQEVSPLAAIYNINGDVRELKSWQIKCSDLKDNMKQCTKG